MTRAGLARAAATAMGVALLASTAGAQPARPLTLDQAISLARDGSAALRAVRGKVDEAARVSHGAFTNYLPRVQTRANYLLSNNKRGILLPAGSLGTVPGLGPFPGSQLNIPQGGSDLFFTLTTVAQPITQYFKIREGLGVLSADEAIAQAGLRRAEQDITFGVMQAYAGLLIAQRGRDVATERVAAAELRMSIQTTAVSSGSAIDVNAREARVRWLQARQDVLEREGEMEDLTYTLTDLLGLPAGTQLQLSDPAVGDTAVGRLEDYEAEAVRDNPDVLEAEALVTKTTHGVAAARTAYIPDVGLLAAHLYQNSIPFFPKNTIGMGISGSITLLDFGARRSTVQERQAQLSQAQNNLDMVEGKVRGQVESAYRKLARAREVVSLAREAVALRSEAARLSGAASSIGYGVQAAAREANADRMSAEEDLLKAQMGELIARAELRKAAGTLGPAS